MLHKFSWGGNQNIGVLGQSMPVVRNGEHELVLKFADIAAIVYMGPPTDINVLLSIKRNITGNLNVANQVMAVVCELVENLIYLLAKISSREEDQCLYASLASRGFLLVKRQKNCPKIDRSELHHSGAAY
jgi:hypothetical protein